MVPFNGKSHFLYMQSFVKALLERQHEVTLLTSFSMLDLKLANYTEVLIDKPFDFSSQSELKQLCFLNKQFFISNQINFHQFFLVSFDDFLKKNQGSEIVASLFGISQMKTFASIVKPNTFENPNVQKFINSKGLHFDLVINEEFFGDSYLMFAHKFKAPIITIVPFGNLLFGC